MPRKKSLRVVQLRQMPHVFVGPLEPEDGALRKFATARPLVLDLGCGRGDTTVAMAASDPSRHYLGVDLKPARVHRGAEASQRLGLPNVAFAAFSILHLHRILPDRICDEGFMFFPDPFLKQRTVKHRLTSPDYLEVYRRLMRPGARVHLKTDSLPLFEYSLRMLTRAGCCVHQAVEHLPWDPGGEPAWAFQSTYEARYRREGRSIHYISFQVN